MCGTLKIEADSSKKLAWTNTVNYFQSSISDVGNSFMTYLHVGFSEADFAVGLFISF